MYPRFIQLETRRRELSERVALFRPAPQASARAPRRRFRLSLQRA